MPSNGVMSKKISRTIVFIPHPQAEHEAGEVQEGGERGAAAGRGERRGHLRSRGAGGQPSC